jgi:RecB family exonuclease
MWPTQVEMYHNKCPLQFYFRHILGLKEPPRGAMYVGIAFHHGVEVNLKQKVESQVDLPVEQVRAETADQWEQLLRRQKPELQEDEKPGELKDKAIQCVTVYHETTAPSVMPALVEQRFRCDMPESPYGMSGRVDLIDIDEIIVDHKTSAKKWTAEEASGKVQLNAYEYGRRKLTGKTDTPGVQVHVVVKKKVPEVQRIACPKTVADMQGFESIHRFVSQAVARGDFPPRTDGWWCSENWCGYWNRCPHGARKAVIFSTAQEEEAKT